MTRYRHYSFDLWLTLIRSNPLFKKERSRIFYERFNKQGKSLTEVEAIFRQVDLMVNAINERTGKNVDADEMYLMVISLINDNQLPLNSIDIDGLYLQMEALLFEHMPMVYCDDTLPVLNHIREHGDATVSILSNTGFIKGCTLRKVLHELGLAPHFDFQIYSDEAGCSKPCKTIFELMLNEVRQLKTIEPHEILHIGDNPVADMGGATAAGIGSHLIHSNETSILSLLTYVPKNVFIA